MSKSLFLSFQYSLDSGIYYSFSNFFVVPFIDSYSLILLIPSYLSLGVIPFSIFISGLRVVNFRLDIFRRFSGIRHFFIFQLRQFFTRLDILYEVSLTMLSICINHFSGIRHFFLSQFSHNSLGIQSFSVNLQDLVTISRTRSDIQD